MSLSSPRDHEMAGRARRLGNGAPLGAKHLRVLGGYCLFAGAFLGGVNVVSWSNHELWPKALVLAPSVLLLAFWLLLDAEALAAGKRRHQKAILWSCIAAGSAAGLALLRALTGSFL